MGQILLLTSCRKRDFFQLEALSMSVMDRSGDQWTTGLGTGSLYPIKSSFQRVKQRHVTMTGASVGAAGCRSGAWRQQGRYCCYFYILDGRPLIRIGLPSYGLRTAHDVGPSFIFMIRFHWREERCILDGAPESLSLSGEFCAALPNGGAISVSKHPALIPSFPPPSLNPLSRAI